MKKKIILDVIMLVLYILVMNYTFTGVLFHEVIAIVISLAFIIHLIFNYKWIINISKNIKKVNNKTKLFYIIDFCIFILFVICIGSGIYISKALFYFTDGNSILTSVHEITSYLALALTILHIVLHFDFFEKALKKVVNIKNNTVIKSIIAITLFVFSVLSSYEFIRTKIINNENKLKEDLYKEEIEDDINQDNVIEDDDLKDNEDDTIKDNSEPEMTLEEFLEDKVCDGCRRRCSLLFPACNIGVQQAEEAEEEYNEIYNLED